MSTSPQPESTPVQPETPTLPPAEPSFHDLGLAPEVLRALDELGYQRPTPIQWQAIPHVMRGVDLLGGAQTGTGKTAAFSLPMLQRLRRHANSSVSPARHPVRALILAPTRELAAQVEESVRAYAKHSQLRATCIFGGVSIDPQIAALRAGCEIVVATPGRLLDHVQQKTIALNQVEFLVLDEADRMLDMGFMPDIRRILSLLPAQRQSLLFSATFPDEVKRLSEQLLKNPIRIEVARPNATADTVTHTIHRCEEAQKRRLLTHLVRSRELRQVLVFTRTRLSARRLARFLQEEGLSAAEIHSDKTQAERMQALADFKSNAITLLVATDIAARGLDITQLPHVINFELPQSAEDYVHRIGRTGRAGQSGEAISLVSPEEDEMLASIERLIKRKLPITEVPDWHPSARFERDRGERADRGGRPARGEGSRGERRRDEPRARSEAPPRRPAAPQDPLFTSAYVPQDTAVATPADDRAPPAARRTRRGPVPALLARLPDPAG